MPGSFPASVPEHGTVLKTPWRSVNSAVCRQRRPSKMQHPLQQGWLEKQGGLYRGSWCAEKKLNFFKDLFI
jgi:hypothetical protein